MVMLLLFVPSAAAAGTWAWESKSAATPATTTSAARPTGSSSQTTPASSSTSSTRAPVIVKQSSITLGSNDAANPLAAALATFAKSLPNNACLVVDQGTTRVVSKRPDAPITPASTEKLLTATAALNVLGPDHRFVTKVVSPETVHAGVLDGDLYLVGDGDPVFSTTKYQLSHTHQPALATSIETLADSIAATGITRVAGTIIGDEHKFSSERYSATWGFKFDVATGTGPLSALVLNDGFTPGLEPQSDPPSFAARALQTLLEKRGVSFGAQAISGEAPGNTKVIASIESPPLLDIVSEMLRNSDNLTAELLAKSVDVTRDGDTTIASSARSVMASLSGAGFPTAGVDLRDSSGLDKNNKATCAVLADVLHGMGRNSDTVSQGLAIAGQTGTLSKRYNTTAANGRLRAKTGSIPGVAGLAGFVDPPAGSTDPVITYAFVVNNADDGTKIWLEDNLVRILTEWDLHG